MSTEIKITEPNRTIHRGHAAFITELDGTLPQQSEKGLFFRDTRLISHWRITADGHPWKLLNSANEAYYVVRLVLTNPKFTTVAGDVKKHTLALTLSRVICGGLHEDIELANYGMGEARFNLEIEIGSDFADIFEVKGHRTVERSGITTAWNEADQSLANQYRHQDFARGLIVRIRSNDARAVFANGKITFPVALKPGKRWHACLLYDLIDGTHRLAAPSDCYRDGTHASVSQHLAEERQAVAEVHGSWPVLETAARQAIHDMVALRLQVPDTDGHPIIAGGVPWFLSLFGRDAIIAALQYQIISPETACGVLERLAALQADRIDDFRDAEPGKIPHELRHGELAFFRKIPHTPYYGTADATPLYLVLLHSTWKSTGDVELLHRHLSTAERCLHWIDHFGDRDGDGFQEYQTRSPAGYENQSWKDAGDAILYPDGSGVKGPKALCELQGYVFDAWIRMAEIFEALGHTARASALRHKARMLFQRFNEVFWDEDAGFYALALDGDKKRVMSIASNPGHCLWSGIVPPQRAGRVIDRLLQGDMWSGWGIRTLSSQHPAFNPFSYQNGSVWPHDNSIIVMGMKRYGFTAQAFKVGRALLEAADCFMSSRLPEVFAGIDRNEVAFPLRYLGANVPQAWATGAIFAIVQALVGFAPDAPRHRLEFDPALPDWLTELEIRKLRMGQRSIDVRFRREGNVTNIEVTKGDPAGVGKRPSGLPTDQAAAFRAA